MADLGRIIVLIGLALVVGGALTWGLGRLGFRGLPGDVSYQGENVRLYFPIVTCIVLSIILTALMWVWRWWGGR